MEFTPWTALFFYRRIRMCVKGKFDAEAIARSAGFVLVFMKTFFPKGIKFHDYEIKFTFFFVYIFPCKD